MSVNEEVPTEALPPTRWGVGDAVAGLLIANAAALFIGAAILAATGYVEEGADGDLPLTMIAVLQIPLWAGYLGAPLWAARRKGNGVVADFGLRMEGWDVLRGIGAGLGTQIVAIPLLYVLIFAITDALGWEYDQDLSAVARDLTAKATDPVGVVLLVLIVAIAAPIIEELFFRGLLLRAIEKRSGPGVADCAGTNAGHSERSSISPMVMEPLCSGVPSGYGKLTSAGNPSWESAATGRPR